MTFKEKLETAQAIVTIGAILVGGLWTYNVFIKERQEYPHANIEQKLSHVVLSDQVNVLRVGIEVSNTGSSLMRVGQSIIRVQQILPLLPCPKDRVCAANEVNDAIKTIERQGDHFSWPLIAERDNSFAHPLDIEPGEKQLLEFEFVVPSEVKVARVYVYFRNDQKFKEGSEVGWWASSYYDFRTPSGGGTK